MGVGGASYEAVGGVSARKSWGSFGLECVLYASRSSRLNMMSSVIIMVMNPE